MQHRRLAVIGTAVLGLVAGLVVTLAVTDPTDAVPVPTAPVPQHDGNVGEAPTPETSELGEATEVVDAAETASTTLLAWVSGGLPAGLAEDVGRLADVEVLTLVRGDQTGLLRSVRADGTAVDQTSPGWAIPLDVIAVEPSTFRAFVAAPARPTVESLQPGQALITEASLELRRIDVGASIDLATGTVEVVGVIDDISGAGAELIVHHSDAERLGVATPRYALVRHVPGAREAVSTAIAELAGSVSVRFRTPAETTWLRHGDAVAPQVFVKAAFGEFSFRDGPGRSVEIDPGWVDDHIVEASVPILGEVRCHRDVVEPLRAALSSLADENLSHLVDPDGYAGCWSPRRIGDGLPLSRHSWGIAVDLNIDENPRGSFSTQDARLVEAMRAAGFTWGGLWLVPDPGHYEFVPPY